MILKQNIYIIVLITFFFGLKPNLRSQDLSSSQIQHTYVIENPSTISHTKEPLLITNYINKWPGFKNAYVNSKVGIANFPILKNTKIGAFIHSNRQGNGLFTNNGIQGHYAYLNKINFNTSISFFLEAGIYQNNLNTNHIPGHTPPEWAINSTSDVSIASQSHFYPDFGIGTSIVSQNLVFAFGSQHLHEPQISGQKNQKLVRKYHTFVSYHQKLNSPYRKYSMSMSPFIYCSRQNKTFFFHSGITLITDVFEPGLHFRQQFGSTSNANENYKNKNSSIILSLKINYLNLIMAYSYDVLLTNTYVSFNKFGAHEVTLGYKLEYKQKRKIGNKAINCP